MTLNPLDPRAPHESGVGSNATWSDPVEALPKPQPGDAVGLCAVDRTYHPIEELATEPSGLVVCLEHASDDAEGLLGIRIAEPDEEES